MKLTFLSALALLFIGLKLSGVITWTWLWVLAPLWLPLAFVGVLLALFGIVYGTLSAIHSTRNR